MLETIAELLLSTTQRIVAQRKKCGLFAFKEIGTLFIAHG